MCWWSCKEPGGISDAVELILFSLLGFDKKKKIKSDSGVIVPLLIMIYAIGTGRGLLKKFIISIISLTAACGSFKCMI